MGKRHEHEDIPLREQFKDSFKQRYLEMLGTEENYSTYIDFVLKPQRKSFRINSNKVEDVKVIVEELRTKINIEPVPWCEGAYFAEYKEGVRTDLGNLYEHFMGRIYVQEATSMLPPLALDIPKDIPKDFMVLDMAAAPGSKTTQLGELMRNQGVLVANEVDFSRLGPLKVNLERAGIFNCVMTNMDGARIDGNEVYDRILLDAPCSGSGVIRKSPKTIKMYNPKNLKSIMNLQLKLLQRAFELLKKDGVMTYSTCSLEPEEDEFCIEEFLKRNPDAKLEMVMIPNIKINKYFTKFAGKEIPKEILDKTIRVWPQDNDTNGFFLAKIRKNK